MVDGLTQIDDGGKERNSEGRWRRKCEERGGWDEMKEKEEKNKECEHANKIFFGTFFVFKICMNIERQIPLFNLVSLLFLRYFLFWEERDIKFE